MKYFTLAVLAVLSLFGGLPAVAQAPSGPSIVIGLADPTSYSKILPLPADGIVHPIPAGQRGAGRVIFRAEIFGTSAPVQLAVIEVPRGTGTMFSTPTMHTFIGGGWDVRQVPSGTVAQVTVIAVDTAGHQSVKSVFVTLEK